MRLLIPLLLTITCQAGCSTGQAPGAPLTDITATNTENTGPFEVFERTHQAGVLRLKVRAAAPEAARAVARHVLYQALPSAERGVIVEVFADGEGGEAKPVARMESFRQAVGGVRMAPQPSGGRPGSADRLGLPGQRP